MSRELAADLHPETLTIGFGYDPATALGSAKPLASLSSARPCRSGCNAC